MKLLNELTSLNAFSPVDTTGHHQGGTPDATKGHDNMVLYCGASSFLSNKRNNHEIDRTSLALSYIKKEELQPRHRCSNAWR